MSLGEWEGVGFCSDMLDSTETGGTFGLTGGVGEMISAAGGL